MISVLQTHTNLIKSLKKVLLDCIFLLLFSPLIVIAPRTQDHSKLAFKVSDLETANKENNRKLHNLSDDVDLQKKNVVELFKLTDEFRKEMEELGEQVGELYLLKKSINVSEHSPHSASPSSPNLTFSLYLSL